MRPAAAELALALDEAVDLHALLLELTVAQRSLIADRRADAVEQAAREIETVVLRLASAEERRRGAAAGLADALGLAAAHWSALRGGLAPDERSLLDPRVARLEALVRELELANAVNGQLIRRELALVDFTVRGMLGAAQPAATRRYTSAGQVAAAPAAGALLLNAVA